MATKTAYALSELIKKLDKPTVDELFTFLAANGLAITLASAKEFLQQKAEGKAAAEAAKRAADLAERRTLDSLICNVNQQIHQIRGIAVRQKISVDMQVDERDDNDPGESMYYEFSLTNSVFSIKAHY